MYAEQVSVVSEDEASATLDLQMLPPVEQRVGLLILAAGEETAVIGDGELLQASLDLAGRLLAHHRT
jgi:proteasome accessory factor C